MRIALILTSVEDDNKDLPVTEEYLREYRCDMEPYFTDYLKNNHPPTPWIATLRSIKEGGRFDGDRSEMLARMISLNPDYIDLEIETDLSLIDSVKENSTSRVILSRHDYSKPMISAAKKFAEEMKDYEGRNDIVIKFVGDPVDSYDMIKSLQLLYSKYPRHIILGIGEAGILSRTLAVDFDQEFVFGAMKPGIIPSYKQLAPLFGDDPIFTGLIGQSLGHSLSPMLHQVFLEESNLSGFYHLFEVEEEQNVTEFIELLRKTSVRGVNITYPYKSIAIKDSMQEELVKLSGVTNTLLLDDYDEVIYAYNTDISGFSKFFTRITKKYLHKLSTILIFGAGGASRAVCFALKEMKKEILVVNRSKERFEDWPDILKQRCNLISLDEYDENSADVYINATTIGYLDDTPTDILPLPENCRLVLDLNYQPDDTVLVKEAKARKIEAYDGKIMLFNQAIDAFEIWTGEELDRKRTYNIFRGNLG